MNIRYRVDLSEAEWVELEALLSGGKHAARKLKRAQILLAADAGTGDEAIRLRRAGQRIDGLSNQAALRRRQGTSNTLNEAPTEPAVDPVNSRCAQDEPDKKMPWRRADYRPGPRPYLAEEVRPMKDIDAGGMGPTEAVALELGEARGVGGRSATPRCDAGPYRLRHRRASNASSWPTTSSPWVPRRLPNGFANADTDEEVEEIRTNLLPDVGREIKGHAPGAEDPTKPATSPC